MKHKSMVKFFSLVLAVITLVGTAVVQLNSFADNVENGDIVQMIKNGENKLRESFQTLEENEGYSIDDKTIITFYTFDFWDSYVGSTDISKASIYDMVKKAEEAGEKYYVAYNDNSAYLIDFDMKVKESEYKLFPKIHEKIKNTFTFNGKEFNIEGYVQFCNGNMYGKNVSVILTDGGNFIPINTSDTYPEAFPYPFSDYLTMYKHFLEYDKKIEVYGNHDYQYYILKIFPFIDLENDEADTQTGKEVVLSSYDDIKKLKEDNLNDFKNSFIESESYSLDGKKVALVYYGLFDLENASLFDMIENAELQNKKRYIAFDGFEGFKTNFKYEVSENVIDRYNLLYLLNAHESSDNTIIINNEVCNVEDRVYFWDIDKGLVVFHLTDKGIFMDFRKTTESSLRKYTVDDLEHLKECYKKYSFVHQDLAEVFTTFALWHHTLDHDRLDKDYTEAVTEKNPTPTDTPILTTEPTPTPTPTTELTPTPESTQSAEPQSPVLWMVIGGIILVAVGGCVFYLLGKKKNNQKY